MVDQDRFFARSKKRHQDESLAAYGTIPEGIFSLRNFAYLTLRRELVTKTIFATTRLERWRSCLTALTVGI